MDITDPNSPIFGVWMIGTLFVALGMAMLTFVNLMMTFEYRKDARERSYDTDYYKRTAKKYARHTLQSSGAFLFAWLWPVALVCGALWSTRVVFQLAEVPTPLSMYRARQQAKIEQLLADARERELERVERERYVDSLERQLGVGEYAA